MKQSNPSTFGPSRILLHFRKQLTSGLLVVVPAGITIFVLRLLYKFTAGQLAPLVRKYSGSIPDFTSPLISVVILLVVVYLIGMITAVVMGKKLFSLMDSIIESIPFVKSVYVASKQIVQALHFRDKLSYPKTPVMIEYPRPGLKAIGFAVGTITFHDGRFFYRVFIPTAPNVTVGIFLLMPPEDVYHCGLSIDEAIQIIVTGGILGTDELTYQSTASEPLTVQLDENDDEDDD